MRLVESDDAVSLSKAGPSHKQLLALVGLLESSSKAGESLRLFGFAEFFVHECQIVVRNGKLRFLNRPCPMRRRNQVGAEFRQL